MITRRWRSVLSNKPLVILLAGRSVSWYGNAVAPMALAFAVLDETRSVLDLSVVVAARSIPNVLVVLLGGALADRRSNRAILAVSAAVAAASQFACAAVVATGSASIPLLIGISVVNGSAAALAGPASGSLFRRIVADDQLRDANVLNRGGMHLGLICGTSSAGVIVAAFGPSVGLATDALTFLIAATLYCRLPEIPLAAHAGRADSLADGLKFILSARWIKISLGLTLLSQMAFAGGLQVLGPVVADHSFGRAGLGFAAGAQTAGPIFATLIAARLPDRIRLSSSVLASGVLAAPLLVLALNYTNSHRNSSLLLALLIAAMMMAGVGLELASLWEDLIVQRHVPMAVLGKVLSYYAIASIGGLPLGEILTGPLTKIFSVPGTLIFYAGLVLVAVTASFSSRSVRQMSSHPELSNETTDGPVPGHI